MGGNFFVSVASDLFTQAVLLTFSPDSHHLGYVATTSPGRNEHIVVDGQITPPYNPTPLVSGIERPIFSPDSKHVAYVAQKGTKQFVVVDGQASDGFDRIETFAGRRRSAQKILFSPDSKHVAFFAENSGMSFAVRDNIAGEKYEKNLITTQLKFSPDSAHLAFGAWGEKSFVVLNGKLFQTGGFGFGHTTFSHDSRHLAVVQIVFKNSFVTIDGIPGPSFDSIVSIDPTTGAGLNFHPDGVLEYLAEKDHILYRVKEIPNP